MSDSLRKYLIDLHRLIKRPGTNDGIQLIDNMKHMIDKYTTVSEFELCASLLFSDEYSLLKFMKTHNIHKFTGCVEGGLQLIEKIMASWDDLSSSYIRLIASTMLELFPSCRSSSLKEKIIHILMSIVKKTPRQCIDYNTIKRMFQEELDKKAGSSSSVKCGFLHLMGLVCQYYPDDMRHQFERLVAIYMRKLQEAFDRVSNLKIIEGCLKGLQCILFKYEIVSARQCEDLFRYILKSMQPKEDLSRHAVPIAGLGMIRHHTSQFGCYVVKHYEKIYDVLERWLRNKNAQVRHEAHMAILAFLEQIVEVVDKESDASVSREIYMFFVAKFQTTLESVESLSKELSIAIKGYGMFAKLCHKYMDRDYLTKMLSVMLSKTSQGCNRSRGAHFQGKLDQVYQMSNFLSSLACIMKEVVGSSATFSSNGDQDSMVIGECYLDQVLQICLRLVESFHFLPAKDHSSCCSSLVSLMSSLSRCPDRHQTFVSKFVSQGLGVSIFNSLRIRQKMIQTHMQNIEELNDINSDSRMENASLKNLFLWREILSTHLNVSSPGSFGDQLDKNQIQTKRLIFKEILQTIHRILKNLQQGNIREVYNLEDITDHDIIKEVALFWKRLLSDSIVTTSGHTFMGDASSLTQTLLEISSSCQLSVGAYDMLTSLVTTCFNLGYFRLLSNNDNAGNSLQCMDVQQCSRSITKSVPEVVARIAEFDAEATYASLLFLLSLPGDIAMDVIQVLVKPLQMAFRLGLSNVNLADAALNALERWKSSDESLYQMCLLKVLPDIELYVSGNDVTTHSSSVSIQIETDMRSGVAIKTIKEVKKKALQFLASVSGLFPLPVMAEDPKSKKVILETDLLQDELCYIISLPGTNVKLPLAKVLSHVCELAVDSADRQARLTACEVVHSIMIFIIGHVRQHGLKQSWSTWGKVYQHLMPGIIKLGCDSDPVTKSVFELLVMQIIHWFSMEDGPNPAILLDIIMDGLADESNEFHRDFYAQCMGEFVLSIARQYGESNDTVVELVMPIFEQLCNFAIHSNSDTRRSAAVGFNSLYKIIGENGKLLDEFIFQLLGAFVGSLAHSHSDYGALGTTKACKEALGHIENLIIENKDILTRKNTKRQGFPGLEGNEVCLETIVEWLLKQCAITESVCRKFCMESVIELSSLLPNAETFQKWIEHYVEKHGAEKLCSIFDDNIAVLHELSETAINIGSTTKHAKRYIELLLASLDCYHWALEKELFSPDQLSKGLILKLLDCVDHFVNEIIISGHNYQKNQDGHSLTNKVEISSEDICEVTMKTLELAYLLFQPLYMREEFATKPILNLFVSCLLDPTSVGFDVVEELNQPESFSIIVCNVISDIEEWPDVIKQEFVSQFHGCLALKKIFDDPVECIRTLNYEDISKLVWTYHILLKCGCLQLLLPDMTVEKKQSFAEDILNSVFSSFVNETGSTSALLHNNELAKHRASVLLLKLAFSMDVKFDAVLDLISNKSTLCAGDGEQLLSTQGAVFFSEFKTVLCQELCAQPHRYIAAMSNRCTTETGIHVLHAIIDVLSEDRVLSGRFASDFVKSVFTHWSNHISQMISKETAHDSSPALLLISKLIALHPKVASNVDSADYDAIFHIFSGILKSKTLTLRVKNEILKLLYHFVPTNHRVCSENLKSCLLEFCSVHFPSQSAEFQEGSQQLDDYLTSLKCILQALEKTGSPEILSVLASVFCREPNHILKDEFFTVLSTCMHNVPDNVQKEAIDTLHTLHSSSPHPVVVRCRIGDIVLLPLLLQCSKETIEAFFVSHIGEIMACIAEDLQKVSTDSWKDKLSLKSTAYKLIRIMFMSLSKNVITTESSPLTTAFASSSIGQGSTKMLRSFMSWILRDKSLGIKLEKKLLGEELRQFSCFVLNAAIAAVTCTQTELKWFDAFIFSHNPKKNEPLFDSIIDQSKDYNFPFRKTYYKLISRISAKLPDPVQDESSGSTISSISSFRYDTARFDMNAPSSSASIDYDVRSELEQDAMNEHECMQNLVCAVLNMKGKSIGFPIEYVNDTTQHPAAKWMGTLTQRLISEAHINVKIFIVKLIINCRSILEPYYAHFLVPVTKVLVQYMRSRSKSKIDQFVEDALITILCWNYNTHPKENSEELLHLRALLEILMQHCPNKNQEIFKRNSKLFSATLRGFKKSLSNLSTDFIYYCSTGSDGNDKTLQVLHLLACLLSNGYSPYKLSIDVERRDYFERIFGYVLHSSKSIVDVASGIMGLSLRYVSQFQKDIAEEIHDLAKTVLRNLGNLAKSRATSMASFISSLYKVVKYHPPVVEPFTVDILYLLPKVPSSEMKMFCIETVRMCMSDVDSTIAELKAKDFFSMLINKNELLQHCCMKLLNKLADLSISYVKEKKIDLEHFSESIKYFLPHVRDYMVGDQSVMCRQEMYEIAMKVLTFQIQGSTKEHSNAVFNDSKYILIHGLGDPEEVLRLQVMNFWSDNLHLIAKCDISDLGGKLMALFEHLYTPEADELSFLMSCCDILMRSASQDQQFSENIFNRSLFDCQYEDLLLTRFLNSGQKQLKKSQETVLPVESDMSVQDNADMEYDKKTVSSPHGTLNWMTGEVLCSTVMPDEETSTITQSSDAMPGMQDMERRRLYFLKELATRDKLSKKSQRKSNNIEGKSSSEFQKGKLQMYRTYRTGKLPDLKISHRDIIIPLTALTQCSPDFLRFLMSTLVNAILQSKKQSKKYMEDFSEVLNRILSKSKQHNPTFISCILTIILNNIESLSIDISLVSQVAKKSSQTLLGIRIIEEKLIHSNESLEPRRKRQRVSEESSELCNDELHEWMSLARLYSEDFDMLRGIFSLPKISRSRFKKVMHLESEGEYKKALKFYGEALTEEVDSQTNEVEKTLWEDCLINCLEKLTKWNEVNEFCMKQMDGSLGNAMHNPEFQERFLLPSLHAKSLLMMKGSVDSREELRKFFVDAINDSEVEKKIVERDYCYHIALTQAHKGDYGQALFYMDLALGRVQNTWKTHDKGKVMAQLLHITDLADYLQLIQNDARMLSVPMIEKLCHRWSQRLPYNQVNSLDVWEDMSTNRSYFLDHLVQALPSSEEQSSVRKLVAEIKIDMYVDSVTHACREKCFNKAAKFINENVTKILQSFSSTSETNFLGFFKHSIGLVRCDLNFSCHRMALNESSQYLREAAVALVKSYRCLKDTSQSHILTEHQSKRSMVFSLLGQNLKLMMDLVEYDNVDSDVLENISGLIGCGNSVEHIKEAIAQEGYNVMKMTVDETFKSHHVTNCCVQMFITFAKLCDQVLKKNDLCHSEATTDIKPVKLEYAKEVIRYTLRAMHYGGKHESSQEAIIKFPRLLQLVEQFPEAKSFFSAEAEEVPTWMFLKWISQMIAILDKPESDAIHSIICKLSTEYPQAVIYAVKTSLSQFQFHKTDSSQKNKKFVSRLISQLDSEVPNAQLFIKNLTMLANPYHIFKSWYDTACSLLQSGDSSSKSQLFTNYQNMYNELFALNFVDGRGDSTACTLHGRFAAKYQKDVDKAFGGSTGGHVLLDVKKFRAAADKIIPSIRDFCNCDRPSLLKEYSHWLANFHVTCYKGNLEIPGQYGKVSRKPMPEYHVKIAGFEDRVLVLSSMQQPKRITIKGTDSKRYPYLVKGNEDLRQDQRIQQLFETVNIALQRDPECLQRQLKVETYQVIPVTDRLGLVEWVENSPTLMDILNKELKRTNREECPGRAQSKYKSWLDKYARPQWSKQPLHIYGNMVKQAGLKEASATYYAVVAEMPSYILRESLQRLCINPEAFLTLRKRFVCIYGTLCAVHWILGIGDRHASNCLLSEKSGSVIGIDFGHAFGSATEILPVPELVPFRLTIQIGNVMVPHPIREGLLRQCMFYSLHALRRNQETIIAMLDIFLKEPSIDWIKRAGKSSRQQESSSGISSRLKNASLALYPSRKIDCVKAKLQGGNPVALLREELSSNSSISSYLADYIAIAEGGGDISRATYSPNGLSVDQQVDCLLDLATDPNVLGRTYTGWRFWL